MRPEKRSARGGTAVRNEKRTIYIVCAALAAVFIIAVAVVLRGVSDKRVYNNYMQQAQQSYSSNDFDSALSALRKAASIDETDDCLMLMADCYETQGNYTKALEVLRRMDLQNPTVASRTAPFSMMTGLTELYLDNNPLRSFTGLRKLRSLTTLGLSGTGLTDEGLDNLSGLVLLRTLYVEDNPSLTGEAVDELSATLGNCTIEHSGLAYSVSIDGHVVTTDAETLSFPSCGIINIENIAKLPNLVSVDLSGNCISNLYSLQYADCRFTITDLNLSGNRLEDITPLSYLQNIERLDVSYNDISSELPFMAMYSLESLNLTGNPLTDEQVELIRKNLPNCDVIF